MFALIVSITAIASVMGFAVFTIYNVTNSSFRTTVQYANNEATPNRTALRKCAAQKKPAKKASIFR
jgi:hypothetical protein